MRGKPEQRAERARDGWDWRPVHPVCAEDVEAADERDDSGLLLVGWRRMRRFVAAAAGAMAAEEGQPCIDECFGTGRTEVGCPALGIGAAAADAVAAVVTVVDRAAAAAVAVGIVDLNLCRRERGCLRGA